MKRNTLSQAFVWERLNMSLKYVRTENKKAFVPKIIIRKAEKKFTNNPKVG